MSGPVYIAQSAWGEDLPDWVLALAKACAESSQNRVAEAIDRSPSLVSNVLRRKYPGNMAAIEELVRGVFMATVIDCPALGPLSTDQCQVWRSRARHLQGHNTRRVRMYRACRRCPRFTGEDQE